MLSRDPFDVLVDAAERQGRRWDGPIDLDADPAAATILKRVMAGPVTPFARRRKRRRAVIGVLAAGVVVAGSAVAASTFVRRSPTTVRALACWNHAPLGDDGVILGTRFGREDPVETCARLWAEPENQEFGVTGPFVTCVADYGTAVVIPGAAETACDEADLDRFDGNIPEELLAIRDVEDELAERIVAGTCFDEPDAVAAARQALDAHGLDDWTVTVVPIDPADDDVCGVFSFDEATSTATIGWIPRDL